MNPAIQTYNDSLSENEKKICDLLAQEICSQKWLSENTDFARCVWAPKEICSGCIRWNKIISYRKGYICIRKNTNV